LINPQQASRFASTRWTLVQSAGADMESKQRALSELCEIYWFPLYNFLRRSGHTHANAEDLTQGFFSELIEKDFVSSADPERGRFRTFLLTALKRFAAKQHQHNFAQKRGGSVKTLSIDFAVGDQQHVHEPAHSWTAEREFERQWALTLLQQTMSQLRDSYLQSSKAEIFAKLKPFLTSQPTSDSYSEIATELGMSLSAVKVTAYRMRQKHQELLRTEVRNTTSSEAEVEEELKHLAAALSSEADSF
jgi:RNA polymerase sigma factor (sigma-70 family)